MCSDCPVDTSFASKQKLIFGRGSRGMLTGSLMSLMGPPRPVLLVVGRSVAESALFSELSGRLEAAGFEPSLYRLSGEPSPERVDAITEAHRAAPPSAVVAIGGGSVMDAGKAVAAMLMEEGSVIDFLEGVGHKQPSGRRLPLIALPSTAGTGSECTKNAVISRPGPGGFKKSLRHDRYVPDFAIVDPDWLDGLPRPIAVACGMDAFCQLLESFLSTKASPSSDAVAWQGLSGFVDAFSALLHGRADPEAIEKISLGAALSGLALAEAGLGTVHGLAGAIGGLCEVPHGQVCGLLLEPVMAQTFARLRAAPAGPALDKLHKLEAVAGVDRLEDVLSRWSEQAALPSLGASGMDAAQIEAAAAASGDKNNPVLFTEAERLRFIQQVF